MSTTPERIYLEVRDHYADAARTAGSLAAIDMVRVSAPSRCSG
jgi:hypothetical protein